MKPAAHKAKGRAKSVGVSPPRANPVIVTKVKAETIVAAIWLRVC